jgi:hypothetical protein
MLVKNKKSCCSNDASSNLNLSGIIILKRRNIVDGLDRWFVGDVNDS